MGEELKMTINGEVVKGYFVPQDKIFEFSCEKIRERLREDKGIYDGFVASIISAIDDINKHGIPTRETMALAIMERLIGDE